MQVMDHLLEPQGQQLVLHSTLYDAAVSEIAAFCYYCYIPDAAILI